MKKLLILVLAFMPIFGFTQEYVNNIGIEDCFVPLKREPGRIFVKLGGDVRIVVNPGEKADFKVVISPNADLKVKVVEEKQKYCDCGLWRWVDKGEAFSIRFVEDERDADFSISFTKGNEWYGCRVCDD